MVLKFKIDVYTEILKKLKKLDDVNHDNICAICRDSILIDTITLSCNHRFHSECLLNSFVKYEHKKCPFCKTGIILDSFKTTCSQVQKNNTICGKKCYNDEKLCKRHINIILNRLEKNQMKERNKIMKKIKLKENKLNKLLLAVNLLQKELDLLKLQLN